MAKIPLRNLLSLIQKRFLQTTPTPASVPKAPPLKSALLLSKRLRVHQIPYPESSSSVLNCLKSYGFEDTHIAKLVSKRPEILHSRVDSKLKPKLEYLIQKGLTGKFLADLIVSNPLILLRSLDAHTKPSFEFLSAFLNTKEMLVALKRSCAWLLTFNLNAILRPNVDLLISEGISATRISRLLVIQPRVILQSHGRMVYAVKTVKEIGLEPKEPKFIDALRVICSFSKSNWEKKVKTFMSLGWSKEEVFNSLRKDPISLTCSEKKLRYLMDFYVNTMKLDAKTIIAYPKLLLYSVDRILARYEVFKVLESMKLIKEDKKVVWEIPLSEKEFLEKYITKNKDKVPGLLDMYQQALKRSKTTRTRGKNEKIDPKSPSLTL
ncbi:uncharacterized protein LOC111309924 [Durio zibethinus]|uniref:Uncharacterized protein LOC111309924 n=1 Tax=Durio zibethinus TaxID=66656 RepID=A0A6P6AIH0_DURZI|nr:uncharacterized protein LOC111309924 [Durio zibethinus]